MKQKDLVAIISLSVVGLGIALYTFLHNQGFATGEFCTLSETVNCDVVNKGPYSRFLGIPVSAIGVIGYLFLLAASIFKYRQPNDKELTKFLALASAVGLLFSFYLTGLEAFILHAWCILCVTSQVIILLLSGFVFRRFYIERKT